MLDENVGTKVAEIKKKIRQAKRELSALNLRQYFDEPKEDLPNIYFYLKCKKSADNSALF